MLIIGITGTLGAGKGTVVEYLVDNKDFNHYSVRDYITQEIKKRNLPVDRDHMVKVANDLRAKHSPSFIVDQLYATAVKAGTNSIIESIRTPGEIESLRSKGHFVLIAVDAGLEARFQRIRLRDSETDHINFDKFKEDEAKEMNSSDPNKQNLKKCIEVADFTIHNDGSIKDLCKQVDMILENLTNSK